MPTYSFSDLGPRSQALLNSHGAGNVTVVQASLVRALRGNGNAAIYLSQLLWWAKQKGDEGGWFWRTRAQMKERCGLGEGAQKNAEKLLKRLDFVETDRKGMPAKKYYRLNLSLIETAIVDDAQAQGASPPDKGRGDGTPTSQGGIPPGHGEGASPPDNTYIESNKESKSESGAPARGNPVDEGDTDTPVEIHQKYFGAVRLSIGQKESIRQKVDDLELWDEVVEWWMLNDFRGRSVGRMLARYEEQKAERQPTSGDGDGVAGVHHLTAGQKKNDSFEVIDGRVHYEGESMMKNRQYLERLFPFAPDKVDEYHEPEEVNADG